MCNEGYIFIREVQHEYVGVWSSDRRDGMGGLEREREEWVDGWTRGMGGLLVIIHDSIYG